MGFIRSDGTPYPSGPPPVPVAFRPEGTGSSTTTWGTISLRPGGDSGAHWPTSTSGPTARAAIARQPRRTGHRPLDVTRGRVRSVSRAMLKAMPDDESRSMTRTYQFMVTFEVEPEHPAYDDPEWAADAAHGSLTNEYGLRAIYTDIAEVTGEG